jgi:hypothetical protein
MGGRERLGPIELRVHGLERPRNVGRTGHSGSAPPPA